MEICMKEYKIISYDKKKSVEKEVNELIKKGWQPVGGCTLVLNSESKYQPRLYTQAVFR